MKEGSGESRKRWMASPNVLATVDAAEKSSEMRSQGNSHDGQQLHGNAKARERLTSALGPKMNPPHCPDQRAGNQSEHKMQKQEPMEPLALKLPPPGQNSRNHYWKGGNCCQQ